MSGLLILILLFIVMPILWRRSAPYLFRWAQRRTAEYMRRSMGMPPRDEERRKSGYHQSQGARQGYYGSRRRNYGNSPIIPKEYAVDVDFTEVRTYSSEESIASDGDTVRYSKESQVSDAEIIEIRKDS